MQPQKFIFQYLAENAISMILTTMFQIVLISLSILGWGTLAPAVARASDAEALLSEHWRK